MTAELAQVVLIEVRKLTINENDAVAITLPEDWSVCQMAQFANYFWALIDKDEKLKREKFLFLPGGSQITQVKGAFAT